MSDPQEASADWIHLPQGVEIRSLWDSLHDGLIRHMETDRMKRTAILRFDVDYVRNFNQLPAGAEFEFRFRGVKSLRVARYRSWYDNFAMPEGLSRDEQTRVLDEFSQNGREESVSWTDFEKQCKETKGDGFASVINAGLAVGGSVTTLLLRIECMEGGLDVFISGQGLEIYLTDGRQLSLDEFLELGEAYWTNFALKSKGGNPAVH